MAKRMTKAEFCELANKQEDIKRTKREIEREIDRKSREDITVVSDARYDRVARARR
jgi:hypothetical protein